MASTTPDGQRPIGFWLKLVDRLIDDAFDAALGQAGLTRRHWQVLSLLQEAPATVQQTDAQLAPFLDGDQPTTRPVLDDLHARGWIGWSSGSTPPPSTSCGAWRSTSAGPTPRPPGGAPARGGRRT